MKFISVLATLCLCACSDNADLKKTFVNDVDGWKYLKPPKESGLLSSVSSRQDGEGASGIDVKLGFECTLDSYLRLTIETFVNKEDQPAPIKLHFAKSAFGKFPVADIIAYNNKSKFTLVASGSGKPNAVTILISPGEKVLDKKLTTPFLELSIPMINSTRKVFIPLSNPNIEKVFLDCSYKPAFMTSQ